MLTTLLFPWLTWLALNKIKVVDETIVFQFSSIEAQGICPCCQQASTAVHSRYQRGLADLPWAGNQVLLEVIVRKFFCSVPGCPRKIFCDRIHPIAAPHARRTERLYQEQQRLGLELGGVVGARTARRQGTTVSATTVLRQVRQTSLSAYPTPRKIGVDDWAFRKGKTYGTILVDLEQHQPVDLLPDRTAETLAHWLQEHPGVEVITRDRGKDYIEGANLGAPDAIQVADRFHLVQNVREMLQRLLERHQTALRAAATAAQTPATPVEAPAVIATSVTEPVQATVRLPPELPDATLPIRQTKAAQQREAHRMQRLARYEQVRALASEGFSQRAIARHLHLSIHTVRHFLKSDQFPERATRRRMVSKLDPFLPFLRQQLAAGHDNAMQLWRELCDQHGYKGSRALVSRWVAHHRHLCPLPAIDSPKSKRRGKPPRPSSEHVTQRKPILSARQAAWLLLHTPHELDEEQEQCRQHLCQHSTTIQTVYALVQEFITMLRQRTADSFSAWLMRADSTKIPELQSFVGSLRSDYAAIKAALSLPESNAQCEGQVNRLKFIKRSMYGRAKFDLLRLRVLLS